MNCDDTRLALWPDPAAAVAPAEARAHFEACASCRQFFAVQGALGRRLAGVARPAVPAHLAPAVRRALARRPSRVIRWVAAASLAAAALAVGIGLSGPRDLAHPLVAHAAPPAAAFRSADLREVEAWLAEQLGRAVVLPAISDATLEVAWVASVGGERAAAARYELHGLPLTYLALPGFTVARQRLDPATGIRVAAASGYEVAVWAEPDGAKAVVAPMTRDEVMAIATECRTKALMRIGLTADSPRRSPAPYRASPPG